MLLSWENFSSPDTVSPSWMNMSSSAPVDKLDIVIAFAEEEEEIEERARQHMITRNHDAPSLPTFFFQLSSTKCQVSIARFSSR